MTVNIDLTNQLVIWNEVRSNIMEIFIEFVYWNFWFIPVQYIIWYVFVHSIWMKTLNLFFMLIMDIVEFWYCYDNIKQVMILFRTVIKMFDIWKVWDFRIRIPWIRNNRIWIDLIFLWIYFNSIILSSSEIICRI